MMEAGFKNPESGGAVSWNIGQFSYCEKLISPSDKIIRIFKYRC